MWSTAAVFYSGAMNPPTCLLYLHGMSGPERLKPSETSLIVSHSFRWTSDRRGRGGGVNGTGEYVCVCVCLSMCELSNTNIHTCTFTLSAAQMCTDTQNEHVTHTSLHHTPPSPALCFVMIFIPHRWLMTVLSWAFVVNAACLSLYHKPNQNIFVDTGQLKILKNMATSCKVTWKWFIFTILVGNEFWIKKKGISSSKVL